MIRINPFSSHAVQPNPASSDIGMYLVSYEEGLRPTAVIEKHRQWLKPSDPSTNHNNAMRKCHVDTGKWLLEHSMYKEWKQKNNSFMWIHGICE
jgi:hypothetical protein